MRVTLFLIAFQGLILCNDIDGMERDDQEMNSGTSNKSNSLLGNGEAGNRNLSCQQDLSIALENNNDSGLLSSWETLMQNPILVKGSEPWCTNADLDPDNLNWKEALLAANANWTALDDESRVNVLERTNFLGENFIRGEVLNFFEEYHGMVECLAKWRGCHKTQDHEIRRKSTSGDETQKVWLDIDRIAGREEEGPHQKLNKKHKGEKHGSKNHDLEEISNKGGQAYNSEASPGRKKHKIWSSKNRIPEKNMPTTKVHFQQSFNGADISSQSLGCTEFRMGSEKLQAVEVCNNNLTPQGRSRCLLYKQIAAKQAKLVEIAARINTTLANGLLISSIKGISYRNLKKFSAKINEEGEVNIDEDMVEDEPILVSDGENLEDPVPVSYADMPRTDEEKHKDISQNRDKGPDLATGNRTGNRVDEEGFTVKETPEITANTEINLAKESLPSGNKGAKGRGHTRETIHMKPTISVMETKNSFALLDEEGNEIVDMQGEMEEDNAVEEIPKEMHTGWIRNLYNFGDGYLAAVRFQMYGNVTEDDDICPTDSPLEDVESETDGNAVFMKTDGPVPKPHKTIQNSVISPKVDTQTSHALGRKGDLLKSV
ncbi:hypothetical protein L1987_76436 [Smallanthus sonchifolius]|uniref:Uncharacterized protein n=1 Tax=Smallanthus sonchifolius TaxID=185202 RepID=A0ACB8Z7A6_9ASTR|nr:hypothetical protein L1987_76436 [Smallanthus sonchifolius]